jgi:four helix bundle protein
MPYKSYRDLEIFVSAKRLAIEIHKMAMQLPRHELYEEGSQIRRSSKSVVSNIVEGYGRRRYRQDFIRFLCYSLASCDETKEHLDMLHKTNSLADEKLYQALHTNYSKLGRQIHSFINSVEANHRV